MREYDSEKCKTCKYNENEGGCILGSMGLCDDDNFYMRYAHIVVYEEDGE
jgi:hypothetical protein